MKKELVGDVVQQRKPVEESWFIVTKQKTLPPTSDKDVLLSSRVATGCLITFILLIAICKRSSVEMAGKCGSY